MCGLHDHQPKEVLVGHGALTERSPENAETTA